MISQFPSQSGVGSFTFEGDVTGDTPVLVITTPDGHVLRLEPADLGEFAGHTEGARKALLSLWMRRDL